MAGCLLLVACQAKSAVSTKDASLTSEALPAASFQVPTSELVRLDITQPGKETVTLSVSSGSWSTVSPLPYPANEAALESIVAVLAEIEIQHKVAERREAKHRLSADAGIVVQAWTQRGAMPAFSIGASQHEETYVQRVGEEAVYAVRGKCRRFFDLSFQQLRDASITKLDLGAIEGVAYQNSFGEIELVADPSDAGSFIEAVPSIRNFDRERATKNVAVLSKLFAKSFVDAPFDKSTTGLYGADTAHVVVSLRGKSEAMTVYIGTQSKNGRLHLRTSESEQVYLVSAHLASSLLAQRSQLERSDAQVKEQSKGTTAREASPKTEESPKAPEHKHGTSLPTQVPAELMSELRALAKQQAD